jgi:hypothetical protein
MADGDANPVVLLSGDTWHIVESSRQSPVALCGRPIRERRAHSRLKTVGREHVCSLCLKAYDHSQQAQP